MTSFDFKSITTALDDTAAVKSGVDFSGKSLKLDSANDAKPIIEAIKSCPSLHYLTLTGNTLGVPAAEAIAKALEQHPELKVAKFSDMFTGRMKTEIPPALAALGDGMISAGARLRVLDLSDNAFGPIGVEGLAKLLQSDVCSELEELRLNNNGLGITGGRHLASALGARPRRLKIFIAGRNRLENEGATALAGVFKKMGTLEELAMPQNGIYHVGISALSDAFKHNPNLAKLNLNDNTIGAKGAAAVADALPKLRNLKDINFGDCLLKSKGASALAKAFKDNSVLLEAVDLSHNEIGREACMEVVDALTHAPDASERLGRVALAGNSLGGTANKKTMRDKLGPSAELSDGEGSDEDDDECASDSESDAESEGSDDGDDGDGDESTGDDAQRADTVIDTNITLDTSIVREIDIDTEAFLKEPTLENLKKLGPNPDEVIYAHLESLPDGPLLPRLVEASACVGGAGGAGGAAGAALWARVGRAPAAARGADHVLRALQLIKSEDKQYKIRWSLPENYAALASVIDDQHFTESLRNTIKFFIKSKMSTLSPEVVAVIRQHPNLYS